MFSLSQKAVAFNLLSQHAPQGLRYEHEFFYYNPAEILDFCLTLTPKVSLGHTYLPHDFTVFLYR